MALRDAAILRHLVVGHVQGQLKLVDWSGLGYFGRSERTSLRLAAFEPQARGGASDEIEVGFSYIAAWLAAMLDEKEARQQLPCLAFYA